jgi:tetratricopeptide (TPR) repeat protein
MRIRLQILSACVLISTLPAAWAAGGAPMSVPQMSSSHEESPQDKAKGLYNDGVRAVRKADRSQAASTQLTDAGKKSKALREAHDQYVSALAKFEQAVNLDPRMHEAWNYVGYTNRKLGNYDVALAAYERTLALQPGYPEALEYRGEAYLAMSRIADAEQAYLDLFASNRGLADKLLLAMKSWIDAQRTTAAGVDATAVNDLDKWVNERTQIAGQTAALTRAGAASSWQ